MSSLAVSSKMKLLRQLARTPAKTSDKSLEREARKIIEVLESDARFAALREQIDLFDVFAFRVPDLAVQSIGSFLHRLDSLDIIRSQDSPLVAQYETKERLISAALDLLSRIRYFRTREITEIFVRFSAYNDEMVANKSLECLGHLAEFNIDVFFTTSDRVGLGASPQMEVVAWLEDQTTTTLNQFSRAVLAACGNLLSPNITGTSSDYRSVTWKSGAVPAVPDVVNVRHRSLKLLQQIYADATAVAVKESVINAMMEATRLPDHKGYGEEVVQMISTDTVDVLDFLYARLPDEPFQIVQKLEHEVFWRFYHAPTKAVETAALKIRDRLNTLTEYGIYRDLVGFNGIFERWEDRREAGPDFQAVEEYRSRKAREYALSITNDTWERWRQRIIAFAQTQSNDLATFPKFYEFLQLFAEHRPDLALTLLRENHEDILKFEVPIFRGVWTSSGKENLRQLLIARITQGRDLFAVTKLFYLNKDVDEGLMQSLFEIYAGRQDLTGLNLIVGAAASNYLTQPALIPKFALPSIKVAASLGDASWINEVWYRGSTQHVFADLDAAGREIVLNGLLHLDDIDYHAEDVLTPLAERNPAEVLKFFNRRLALSGRARNRSYSAIPFSFHSLQRPLGRSLDLVVDEVRGWFETNEDGFFYGGARLLKIIFPEFPQNFANKLYDFIGLKSEKYLRFVVYILRNYEGEKFLYDICKEIIAAIPEESSLTTEVSIVLQSTGVVTGEFGFAEAYEEKIEALRPWENDDRPRVRDFGRRFIKALKQISEEERRRATESIELRKHEYGEDGNVGSTASETGRE
ncbi:Uncharacterized protein MLTONO_6644 [Mesorhizobium loti]|nr:Uncharacterized protein MLTONO_6644 [Mesorhizobium loti]